MWYPVLDEERGMVMNKSNPIWLRSLPKEAAFCCWSLKRASFAGSTSRRSSNAEARMNGCGTTSI